MAQMKAQVDKLLTNVSLKVESKGLVADEVFPTLTVDQYTGLIGKYGDEHLREEEDLGGGRQAFRRVDSVKYEDGVAYSVQDHGLEDVVTKRDYANIEDPFDAESDKTISLTQKIQIRKERIISSLLSDNTVLTNNTLLAGNQQFNDYANSTPLTVFKNAHQSHIDRIGMFANACVMSAKVFNTLRYHPEILEKLGFSQQRAGLITADEMARAIDVEKLFIGHGIYNSAKKGQSSSIASIWSNNIVMYFHPGSAGKSQVSLGYKLVKRGDNTRKVFKYALDNPPGSNAVLAYEAYDFRITNADAGFLIRNSIA